MQFKWGSSQANQLLTAPPEHAVQLPSCNKLCSSSLRLRDAPAACIHMLMTEQTATRPELRGSAAGASSRVGSAGRTELSTLFAAWQDNVEAAVSLLMTGLVVFTGSEAASGLKLGGVQVWHYYDSSFDAYVRHSRYSWHLTVLQPSQILRQCAAGYCSSSQTFLPSRSSASSRHAVSPTACSELISCFCLLTVSLRRAVSSCI